MENGIITDIWERLFPSKPSQQLPGEARVQDESLIVMIDRSPSMEDRCGTLTKFSAAKQAVMALVDQRLAIKAVDDLAVIAFDTAACVVLPFTSTATGYNSIKRAVRAIGIGGGTDIATPLALAASILPAARKRPIHAILLTDGQGGQPLPAASALKERGVILQVIGTGDTPRDVDEPLLKAVASTLNGKVLYKFLRDGGELIEYFRTEVSGCLVRRS